MTIVAAGTIDLIQSGDPLFFFYEDLADVCYRCSDVLQLFAFTLIFAGLLMQVYKGMIGGDLSGMFRHILVSGIIIVIMPFYGEWMLAAQDTLGPGLLSALEVDPLGALTNFGESFAEAPFDTTDAPSIILGIIDPLAWFEYFMTIIGLFLMACISIVMYALFWCGFQIQIIAIYLGAAAAPIFLSMLVFEQTRDTGVKYHIGLIAICFWPLGWGLGMLFTEAMMSQVSAAMALCAYIFGPLMAIPFVNTVIEIGAVIIILLIIIVWLIVVLFAAPKVVSKAITTGAQIGMGLISAGASTSAGMASAGIGAVSGAAMAVGGAAATVATGGAAAPAAIGAVGGSISAVGGGVAAAGKTAASAGD